MRPVSRSAAHQRSPARSKRTVRQWGMGLDGPWAVPTFFQPGGTGYAFLSGAYGHGGHI